MARGDGDVGDARRRRPDDDDVEGSHGTSRGHHARATLDVVACLDVVDEEDLKRDPHGERNGALCVPMDSKIVKVKLLTRRARDLVGQRFIVRIDRWLANQRYPSGHLVKILGRVGDVDGEMAALLARYDIPAEPFGARALAELPREGADWMVPKEEIDRRRDLRHHRACSIDPPGCTDVDDALSVHVSERSRRNRRSHRGRVVLSCAPERCSITRHKCVERRCIWSIAVWTCFRAY